MRDVTPRSNSDSGMTTGAAPARPATPPAATDMNKTDNPPASK
jgi:hypothetical protein